MWHLEVVFRSETEYFMWIYCDENLVNECVKKI